MHVGRKKFVRGSGGDSLRQYHKCIVASSLSDPILLVDNHETYFDVLCHGALFMLGYS